MSIPQATSGAMFPSPLGPVVKVDHSPVRPLRPLVWPALLSAAALTLAAGAQAALGWWWVSDHTHRLAGAEELLVAVVGAVIVAWILNCWWLWRARANTLALTRGAARHKRAAGWVWNGWWVPLANLWVPFQVVRDVRKESTGHEGAGHLGWWWACWLAAGFLGAGDPQGPLGTTQHWLEVSAIMASVAFVALCGAGVLWVRLVLDVTRAQESRTKDADPVTREVAREARGAASARLRAIAAELAGAVDGAAPVNGVHERLATSLGRHGYHDDGFLAEMADRLAEFWFDAYDAPVGEVPPAWASVMGARHHVGVRPEQLALATVNVVLGHDLPIAFVQTCVAHALTPREARRFFEEAAGVLLEEGNAVRRSIVADVELPGDQHLRMVRLLGSWEGERALEVAWLTTQSLWELRRSPQLRGDYPGVSAALVDAQAKVLLASSG